MPPLTLNWILSMPLKDIMRTMGRPSVEPEDEKEVTQQCQFSDLDGCAGLGRRSPCRKIGPYSERVWQWVSYSQIVRGREGMFSALYLTLF